MANIRPSQTLFLIADALRQEIGNKITIMGAFAAGQILVNPGTKFPLVLPLAIYSVFEECEGKFVVRVRFFDPSGKQIAPDVVLPDVEKLHDAPMQIVLNFNLFQFPMPGIYKVEILLGEHLYTNNISIRVNDKPIS